MAHHPARARYDISCIPGTILTFSSALAHCAAAHLGQTDRHTSSIPSWSASRGTPQTGRRIPADSRSVTPAGAPPSPRAAAIRAFPACGRGTGQGEQGNSGTLTSNILACREPGRQNNTKGKERTFEGKQIQFEFRNSDFFRYLSRKLQYSQVRAKKQISFAFYSI